MLNPLCAILGLDDARIRLAGGGSAIEGLVRPAMREIVATARKLGHDLPDEIMDTMIHCDPMDLYLKPSMQCDFEKVCLVSLNFSLLGGDLVLGKCMLTFDC